MTQQAGIHRLTNLAFALLGAGQTGSPTRSAEWIRRHVEGFPAQQSDEAFSTMLRRDVHTLRKAGVPIIQVDDGFSIQPDDYELAEVEFSADEAMVLGLAGEMGQASELGAFARSGWTKLAAAGASRNLADAPVYYANTDLNHLSAESVTAIMACVRNGQRMTFNYQGKPTSEVVRRRMDPWGLVPHRNRVYLVGWDVDRQEPRSFRALRASEVRRSREPATHTEPTAPLQEIVGAGLRRGRKLIDATVTVPPGMAGELEQAGTRGGDGKLELHDVDKDWLVRTAAGYAPEVIVEKPADVREAIVALLEEAL